MDLAINNHLATPLPDEWQTPPSEFTLIPFWFWNDDLQESELLRQMDDFQTHGVHGFVIHPRVGLPRDIGWMSARMLELMRFVVDEAARRGMSVVLYDEGMYPSGSSCGQVVAENPAYHVRGLEQRILSEGETVNLAPGEELVALTHNRNGQRILVLDRPIRSVIRGLHYLGEGPEEDTPPAGDLLNPDSVACFIRKVYETYAQHLGDHFGKTIVGIFTDEPSMTGRPQEKNIRPGTTGILEHVNRILGYDFTPHLPALWDADEPDAAKHKADYERALHIRLEETYYKPLYEWCEAHGTRLMGHPAEPGDLELERYFHIPGQDLVWRWVAPFEASALEGPESTQGKCSSSAMLHLGRRRNSNECFGAYGHELTYEETLWLVNWCLVRGVNMLIPHAFYYSIRGPRWDERPPDVGPNSSWWDNYKQFAQYCQRLCWLNTDSEQVCNVAILGHKTTLPWKAAKLCFQGQRDFNYIGMSDLGNAAHADASGLNIGSMNYRALIVDGLDSFPASAHPTLATLAQAGRLIALDATRPFSGALAVNSDTLLSQLSNITPPDLHVSPPTPDLRYRHIRKAGADWYLLFNEGPNAIEFRMEISGGSNRQWLNPWDETATPWSEGPVTLASIEMRILHVSP